MTETGQPGRWRFWVAVAAGFLLLLWLLNNILLPFVVGIASPTSSTPWWSVWSGSGLSRTGNHHGHDPRGVLATGVAMAILPPLFDQVSRLIAACRTSR